jgi:copper chaperone NosL
MILQNTGRTYQGMTKKQCLKVFTAISIFILTAFMVEISAADAQSSAPHKPSKKDKCPVCGMFIYKYPDWVAEIVFENGEAVFFDGAKDMFKYYQNPQKYDPHRSREAIRNLFVTEWYDMLMIDATGAFYVLGSDAYGPMGKELIPFARQDDAEIFKHDHKGQRVLTFEGVTPGIIGTLDQ